MGDQEPIFPPGFPEDTKEALLERHRQSKMEFDSIRHDIIRAFDEMPMEHLMALDKVFSAVAMESGPAAYYSGYVDGLLQVKHDICSACGVNHAKELLDGKHE